MNRRIIAGLVVLSLAFSAVACSSKTTETIVTTTEALETTTVTSETTTSVETTEEISEVSETTIEIPEFDYESLPTFEVTSVNLNDGVWDVVISNTSLGENQSPELSWEEVEGATTYAIYMVDVTAGNWLHLKAGDIITTTLEAGSLSSTQYVGPYPPSGTHDYVVYVFALKSAPTKVRGVLDSSNAELDFLFASLDVNESGETGNVISYGVLPGTYSAE